MNNSKKLLASAMALSMVTSVLPMATPVSAADAATSCSYQSVALIKDGINIIKAARKDVVGNYGKKGLAYTPRTEPVYEGKTLETWVEENYGLLTNLVLCEPTSDEGKLAAMLVGSKGGFETLNVRVTTLAKAIEDLYEGFKPEGAFDGVDLTKATYPGVKALLDTLTYYKPVLTIAQEGSFGEDALTRKDVYEEYIGKIEDAVAEYEETYLGVFTAKFVKALNAHPVITDVKVEDLIDGADFARGNLEALENLLTNIKEDYVPFGDVYYSQVKDEDEVVEIIDELEAVVEEIKEVNDLFKSAEYKAGKKLEGSLSALVAAAEDYKANDDLYEDYERELNAVRATDVKVLTTYVEDFFNEFFTVKAVKRSTGNYTLQFVDADYARYVRDEATFDAERNNIAAILTLNVESKNEESVYDALTVGVSDLDKLIKAATTDIEGIALNSTFTSKDAVKIMAAKKAYDELMEPTGPYYSAMSSKEKRAVKANKDLIYSLYAKLILNGNVVKDGWVDLGNGNWDYFVEGKAFTGWVCSAKDVWYYVRDGHMLRNAWVWRDDASAYYVGNDGIMVYGPTTVDGYALDANGLWHK